MQYVASLDPFGEETQIQKPPPLALMEVFITDIIIIANKTTNMD